MDLWEIVTIVAKVVHICDTAVVTAKNGSTKLRLAECTLADRTGTIALDVWEDHIPKIRAGNVYRIMEAQIRVWNGTKKLSTIVASVIEEASDESLKEISVPDEDIITYGKCTKVKVASIHSVESVESYYQCLNCSRKILQLSPGGFLHCDRYCRTTMRKKDCEIHVCAKVVVQSNESKVHLTAFESILKDASTVTFPHCPRMILQSGCYKLRD